MRVCRRGCAEGSCSGHPDPDLGFEVGVRGLGLKFESWGLGFRV